MLAVTAGLAGSEGGTPLSRDGALLYSGAPEGVVIGMSWSRSKAVVRVRDCCVGFLDWRDWAGRASGVSNGGRQPDGRLFWLGAFGLLASRRRADGFLCALSVLRSGRFAFCHSTVGFLIQRSAPSGAVAGRFMELRGADSRSGGRNEASSSRVGGGRLAVRSWVGFGGGMLAGMRAVRASVSWPARPAGCANGAMRSAAPMRVLFR